jgi:hypothetical protein
MAEVGMAEVGDDPRAASVPGPAGGRRGGAGWYPAMVGALAGAAIAIGVMERRLDNALALRPPIVVADYSAFLRALGQGGTVAAIRPLVEQYTAAAEADARAGFVVLRADAVVGTTPGLELRQDSRLLEAARPFGTPDKPAPAQRALTVSGDEGTGGLGTRGLGTGRLGTGGLGTGDQRGGRAEAGGPGGMTADEAASLLAALRGQPARP